MRPASAEDFREHYDTGRATWTVDGPGGSRLIRDQRRQTDLAREGRGAELIRIGTPAARSVTLQQSLPPVPVEAEPEVSLWLRSSRPGATLALRIVLPEEEDPTTGEPVRCLLRGPTYDDTRDWQPLTLKATESAVQERLKRLRATLGSSRPGGYLNTRSAQIDGVCLVASLPAGETDFVVDDLSFGPLAGVTAPAVVTDRGLPPLQVHAGRATIHGRPFFPLATLDQGEPADRFRETNLNLVWMPDYGDTARSGELRAAGLNIMATPRQVKTAAGVADPSQVAPLPYGPETDDVLLWMLGFRVRGSELPDIERSVQQVRTSDRLFRQPRPIAADVVDRSRAFSRRLSVMGSSEQVIHTARTPQDYYFSLAAARSQSLPNNLHMTWIPTEAAPAVQAARRDDAIRPVLEPEQIWMQAYLALAAGYRGLGFYKRTPLASETDPAPGANERTLAIELLARRLRLVERWLGTSKLLSAVPMPMRQADGTPHPKLIATILESDTGWLIIPTWIPDHGQHQPGQMFARDVRLVIPGWHDARGWEVTTTSLRPTSLRRVAGGSELTLDTIDQNTIILVTSSTYLPLKNELAAEILAGRERAAQSWVRLAEAKLARVSEVDRELTALGVPRPRDAESRLAAARAQVQRADATRQAGGFDDARRMARLSMQNLRMLQQRYWLTAVADLPSATSSPYTLGFQTLPDHYRMTGRLRDATLGEATASATAEVLGPDGVVLAGLDPSRGDRLLPGGSFEDPAVTESAGWRPRPIDRNDVRAGVDLAPSSIGSTDRCLRLTARPAAALAEGAAPIAGRTLVVESPLVTAEAGESIRLTVRVKTTGQARGLIYDTIGGPLLAVPVDPAAGDAPGEWQTLTLLRDVRESGPVGFRIELHGVGQLCLDDVRLRRTPPAAEPSFVTPLD